VGREPEDEERASDPERDIDADDEPSRLIHHQEEHTAREEHPRQAPETVGAARVDRLDLAAERRERRHPTDLEEWEEREHDGRPYTDDHPREDRDAVEADL